MVEFRMYPPNKKRELGSSLSTIDSMINRCVDDIGDHGLSPGDGVVRRTGTINAANEIIKAAKQDPHVPPQTTEDYLFKAVERELRVVFVTISHALGVGKPAFTNGPLAMSGYSGVYTKQKDGFLFIVTKKIEITDLSLSVQCTFVGDS